MDYNPQIRYCHVVAPLFYKPAGSNRRKLCNGVTVAYMRNTECIIGATSICSVHDVYTRKIGAAVARERLYKSALYANLHKGKFEKDTIDGLLITATTDEIFIPKFQVIEYASSEISDIVGDHVMDALNVMSFKHNFLSKILRKVVHLHFSKLPVRRINRIMCSL